MPRIHPTAFVEASAHVVGDVEIGPDSSVWFTAVVRADVNAIRRVASPPTAEGAPA